jgi:hypothetical protein
MATAPAPPLQPKQRIGRVSERQLRARCWGGVVRRLNLPGFGPREEHGKRLTVVSQFQIALGMLVVLFVGCGIYGNVGRYFFPVDETVDGPKCRALLII